LYVHAQRVAYFCTSLMLSNRYWVSQSYRTVRLTRST
jgi:hypothetical protein